MRPRKSKKKSFTGIKSEKKNENRDINEANSTNLPFALGDEVLACWQDGLYYLANIKTINEEKLKCQVIFEDDSIYWVLFKHIRTAKSKDEVSCSVCGKTEVTDQNDIVVCDSCFHGYHQTCHTPVIDEQSIEWLCRACVFSRAAKAGGALKSGDDAEALTAMKFVLPYDLNTLQWDAHHKINTDQTYCYCAGPGLWYYKMLECYNCHQWFHEACLQCLDFPLLLGDRFYFFVCAVCNDGEEYIKRIQLKWSDMAALVLYNLSLKYDKRCVKKDHIQLFLKDNWDDLQCGNLHDTPEEERMERFNEVFKQQKHKFRSMCINGVLTWSLLNRSAPCPTKKSLLREAERRSENKIASRFADCNGNYLQGYNVEDNSPSTSNYLQGNIEDNSLSTSNKEPEVPLESEAGTSESSYQPPLFPSLSMFKYLLPNYDVRNNPDYTSVADESDSEHCPTPGDKRPRPSEAADATISEPIEKRFVSYVERLSDGITSYAGTNGRLACGEDCALLGRRFGRSGRIEYLVQWSGVTPDGFK